MTKKELEFLAKELEGLSLEEFERRAKDYLSMDKEIYEVYCREYARRGLEPPTPEMI